REARMKFALDILRKDVHHLWPQIAAFLLLIAGFGWQDVRLPVTGNHRVSFGILLALASWYLIAVAVQQERPSSQRQDWLTRPIPWTSVLSAKALFVVLFICLPILFVQMT